LRDRKNQYNLARLGTVNCAKVLEVRSEARANVRT
jgi:hypothetical protein